MFKKLASDDVPVMEMETLPTQLPGTEPNFGEHPTSEAPVVKDQYPMEADVISKKNK